MRFLPALLPQGLKFAIRRMLHGAVVWILRLRSVPYDFTETGVCLIIAPHPDDETLGCAGLIIGKCLKSLPVHVVWLTDGSASHPGHPSFTPWELAKLRKAEAQAAMQLLGVRDTNLHFLEFQDGGLAHLSPATASALTGQLTALFQSLQPAEIFLPCRHDGSSEHDAAFIHVEKALASICKRPDIHEYPVWSWWNPLLSAAPIRQSRRIYRLSMAGCSEQKQAALDLYRSQTQAIPPWPSPILSRDFLSFFSEDEFYYRY